MVFGVLSLEKNTNKMSRVGKNPPHLQESMLERKCKIFLFIIFKEPKIVMTLDPLRFVDIFTTYCRYNEKNSYNDIAIKVPNFQKMRKKRKWFSWSKFGSKCLGYSLMHGLFSVMQNSLNAFLDRLTLKWNKRNRDSIMFNNIFGMWSLY